MTYTQKNKLFKEEKVMDLEQWISHQLQLQRTISIEPRWHQQFIINLRNAPPIIYTLESESETESASETENEISTQI